MGFCGRFLLLVFVFVAVDFGFGLRWCLCVSLLFYGKCNIDVHVLMVMRLLLLYVIEWFVCNFT